MNPFFLIAALADLTATVVHGYIGHRLIMTRLARERLFSTPPGGTVLILTTFEQDDYAQASA